MFERASPIAVSPTLTPLHPQPLSLTICGDVPRQRHSHPVTTARNMVSHSPVPQGTSRPLNEEATSFLDLPGELRNTIYAWALGTQKIRRIQYYPDKTYRCEKSKKSTGVPEQESQSKYLRSTAIFQDLMHVTPSETGDLLESMTSTHYSRSQWQHKNVSSRIQYRTRTRTSLFLSCRQVYHEAVSHFFVNSIFSPTKLPKSMNRLSHTDRKNHFIDGTVQWLEKIGWQFDLVEGIILDLEMCAYYGMDGWLNVLPLLRVLWKHQHRPKITFSHQHDNRLWAHCKIDVIKINGLLKALISDDLQIKKYSRLLGRVFINTIDRMEGRLIYKEHSKVLPSSSSHFTQRIDEYSFRQTEDGNLVFDDRPGASLLSLPHEVLQNIYSLVVPTGQVLTVDLCGADNRKIYLQSGLGLVYVNKSTRNELRPRFYENGFVLKLESRETRTSFQNFLPLLKWLVARTFLPGDVNPLDRFHKYRGWGFIKPPLVRLDLHVNAKRLRDVRVSIMDLMRITAYAAPDDDHKFFVRIIIPGSPPSGDTSSSPNFFETTLHDLRVAAAKAVCTLINQRLTLNSRPCPEIYIDGFGRPVEYRNNECDEFHRFVNFRGGNRMRLRGWDLPYDGSTLYYAKYLSAVRDGCNPDKAARACKSLPLSKYSHILTRYS